MKRGTALDGRKVLRLGSGMQIAMGDLTAGAVLLIAVLCLAVLSAAIGATEISIADIFRGLIGDRIGAAQSYALWDVRLPRILMAFMVGWSVALAGALLQSIARNPLADPGLFGLSQGSVVTIMLLLVLVPTVSKPLIALGAMGGALFVALSLIWLVGGERSSGLAILLMGIAVETVLSSVSSVLILYTPPEVSVSLGEWIAGSLFQSNWPLVAAIAPLLPLSILGIFVVGPRIATYDLGNDMARALGEPISWSRPVILVFAVVLSAAAVTAAGPLTFLGVLAPQIVGFITPATGRARLMLSGVVGGILVMAADVLARGVGGDLPMPIGLGLALVGVPIFILILRLQALRKMRAH